MYKMRKVFYKSHSYEIIVTTTTIMMMMMMMMMMMIIMKNNKFAFLRSCKMDAVFI